MPTPVTELRYTLAELRDEVHLGGERYVPSAKARAYERALETLARIARDDWSGDDLLDAYLWPGVFEPAGIVITPPTPAERREQLHERRASRTAYMIDGPSPWFELPRGVMIDGARFLSAMIRYYRGEDVRASGYAGTGRPVAAEPRDRRTIDPTTPAARALAAGALGVSPTGKGHRDDHRPRGEQQLSLPEGCEDAPELKAAAEAFLAALCDHAALALRDDLEAGEREDALLELAERCDYLFDDEGRPHGAR